MMNRIAIILGLLYFKSFCAVGQSNIQCDSIKIFNSGFDIFFQNEYISIRADSVLAIRHCPSTNGCPDPWGLLCWKSDGQFYFRKVQLKRNRMKTTSKLNKQLVQQLIKFYDQKIYIKNGDFEKYQFYVDDGPETLMLFKTKDKCWNFSFISAPSNDIRLVWTNELLAIMRK